MIRSPMSKKRAERCSVLSSKLSKCLDQNTDEMSTGDVIWVLFCTGVTGGRRCGIEFRKIILLATAAIQSQLEAEQSGEELPRIDDGPEDPAKSSGSAN